ncbi:response regulator [Desulfitobacterium metallireducens]|uniref:Stage 0 sporulation protein A homolog n=1 Tax=Desulfitobacterium metallireducens DSM 15288 TaxID=871968 RepID=W0E9M6_9FIRM|nr:response regulator transcription factor [Desulfitobacterium metallireducens]AHF05929.1 nitrate/nitrite response regulator protein narL [Desulfitobacterium metallireducens DSM 15288]
MKILIVDDYPVARQGIASILLTHPNMEIVGIASDVAEAIQALETTQPELALIDLRLRNESGLEIVRLAREKGIDCKYIILTSSANREDFRIANEEGVNGYLLKVALPEEILAAVQIVGRGRKYYDPGITELMLKAEDLDPVEQLTTREREVLILLGEGLSNKEIAKNLFVTEYTVKKHVSQVLAKLELSGRTQAALYVSSKGLA